MSRPVASSMGYLLTGWPESALYRYAVVIYADIMFGYELFYQQPDRNNNRAQSVSCVLLEWRGTFLVEY